MSKFLLEKKKFPQTSTNSRQNSGEKQITRILSLKHGKINNPNSAGGSIKPALRQKKPINSNINSNLANKIKNIDKMSNNHNNNHNYMIPNVNINIDKNIIKSNANNIVVNNHEEINNYNNSLEQIQKALNIDNNKNLIYNNFILNNNNINININNNDNKPQPKSQSNKISSTTKAKIITENYHSNEIDNKQKKILNKKNIIVNKNYLTNMPPTSRQMILNKENIYNNRNKIIKSNINSNKAIDLNKKAKYNHPNKFASNNINNNLNEKLIKKENNSLEELKNNNTGFNKGLLISRKIMTATNSPSHSIQANYLNKMNNNNNNNNNVNKVNINKLPKNSKKTFKKAINNYSSNSKPNNNENIGNNNDNSPNLLMDSNKNDISEITYDNIISKDIINSNDNLDTGKSHKISDKNTISHINSMNNTDNRKNTTTKIKKSNDKYINKKKIHNFINNINNTRSKNNVPFNPHNTLRSENETTNKENSANDDGKNKASKNDKIINNKKIIENDIVLDSVNNARSKENNSKNDYDDINCNFNINNYLNENSLREKKENLGKSQKQKDKIKLDKLTEKIISGKIISKKPNDKFSGINNNIKNKKIDKYLDKKNIEQLLLNKEKLIEYNKKLVSKKIILNKPEQTGLNKIPKIAVKQAKKSTHNRNVDQNNFILNNRTNTSVLSTMKDSNYYSHQCEILSKKIKEYYKQTLCYPNTDLNFYKFGRVIGRGAFGKVNIGLNILTGRIVAIKSFNKKNLVSESAKNKILYETNLMRGLYHPSVTKILETFESEQYMLIIMEYISGGNLQNFVKKRRKLCEKTAKILFRQIIQGIRYIHSRGIVHRDIKLENILLDLNNIIKICDFGVGKLIKPNTILKDQCGTPVYMAPEILRGNGYKGFPVDVWSAGVALYIMLSGTLPFNKDKEHDLEYAILNNNIKEIKDISPEGNDLLKNILEKDPNKRYTCIQILEHPWLNSNLNDDENPDFDYNNNIKNVNKYHLFTNAESILLAKTHIDYRNAQKKDLAENFTIKNLYTLDEKDKKNVDTKSAILAPYNSMLSEGENDSNINSSKSKGSIYDELDNFNSELEVKNGIIKFHGEAKEFNMNYELNNNEEIDNGMLKDSKNDLVSVEDDEIKENENIYLVKNNNTNGNKNKISSDQNKKHRPSSPYRPPPINKDFVKMVCDLGYDEEYVIKCLEKKELNHATTVYYLFSNYENVK